MCYAGERESIFNPVAIFLRGRATSFNGIPEIAKALAKRLKLPLSKVYPIHWELKVKIQGEKSFRAGTEVFDDSDAGKQALADNLLKELGLN